MGDLTEVTDEKKEPWEERFLSLLADTGNVTQSSKGARISRVTVWHHRKRRPEFARRYAEAEELGVQALEDEARRRALESSDTLLIFMLKSHKPEVYRETVRNEVLTPEGEAIRGRIEYVNDWRSQSEK